MHALFEIFWNLPIQLAMVELYYFMVVFTKKQPIFYPPTGTTICKQKTIVMIAICNLEFL